MTMLDPHLDVDQLSAAVDGDRDAAVAAHLLTCLSCREQVDAWRRALAPLRDLPAAPPDVDGTIDAAMAAWVPAPAEPSVVPAFAGSSARSDRRRHLRLPHLRPPPALAAALAGLVLIAAALLGVHALGGAGSTSSSASKSSSGAAQGAAGARLPSASSSGSGASSVAPASSQPSAEPTFAPLAVAGAASLAAQLRRVTASLGASTKVGTGAPCLLQARRLATVTPAVANASPTYTEAVRLGGVDSEVFVFGGTHQRVALVMRSGTCTLLATVPF